MEEIIKGWVKEIVAEVVGDYASSEPPEFISVRVAADIAEVDRSIIDSLVHAAPDNGFPAIRLGPRVVKIDKFRFYKWLRNGGLNGIDRKDQ